MCCTSLQGGADVMRLEGYGVDVGCNADFTLLVGETLAHAVVEVAPRPLVVKGGRITVAPGRCRWWRRLDDRHACKPWNSGTGQKAARC